MKRIAKARLLLVAVLAVGGLALIAPSTWAATTTTHPYLFSFDGSETPAGQFSNTTGLAVHDATGTVYVTDRLAIGAPGDYYEQIPVFDEDGNYLRELPLPPGHDGEIVDVAVDNTGGATDGRVYVLDWGCGCTPAPDNPRPEGGIHVYDSLGNYIKKIDGAFTPSGRFKVPTSVAVDQLGYIYVSTDRDRSIHKFAPNGIYVTTFTDDVHLGNPGKLSVDSSGNIYVRTFSDSMFRIAKLDPTGSFLEYRDENKVAFDPGSGDAYALPSGEALPHVIQRDSGGQLVSRFGADALAAATRVENLALNPVSGRIYVLAMLGAAEYDVRVFGPAESVTVADVNIDPVVTFSYFTASVEGSVNPQGVPTTYHFEYRRADWKGGWKKTPTKDAGSGTDPIEVDADLEGLANGVEYELRLIATNTVEDADTVSEMETFTTLAVPPPIPAISSATDITATSVKIEGTVDPEGFATDWSIEVGDQKVSGSFGDVDGPQPVSASITGLAPNTEYTAALTASNPGGTETATTKFTTDALPPDAVTRFAAPRTQTTARLNALVNPRNSATTYWFEYGKTDQYGSRVPAAGGSSAGKGNSSGLVSEEISGLEPGTTYHFRVVATNGVEAGPGEDEVAGEDATFTTRTSADSGPPDRGIELITNPNKGNQAPTIIDYAQQEDKAIWSVNGGAPGSPAGARGQFLAERTQEGWKSASLLPPIDKLFGGGAKRFDVVGRSAGMTDFLLIGQEGLLSKSSSALIRLGLDGSQELLTEIVDSSVLTNVSTSHTERLSKIFVPSTEALAPGHVSGTAQLYEVASTPPALISRMPGGDAPATCGIAANTGSARAYNFGTGNRAWNSTLETVPTRVFFQSATGSCESAPLQLYVRSLSQASTELISGPPVSGPLEPAYFIRANPAGSEALFVTATKLDSDDGNTTPDIYKWTSGGEKKCLTCVVPMADVRMTETQAPVASPADLSRVYFVSSRNLVPGIEVGGSGFKLYVVRNGEMHYVAPVGNAHEVFPRDGLSVDGRRLVFSAAADGITTDPVNGIGQLYQYDEASESVECVSCPETTSPAAAVEVPDTTYAAAPVASGDGRSIVFSTAGRLVAGDINNSSDVYEWRDGKLRLVTDGETIFPGGSGRLVLHGISGNGANVYFRGGANLTGYEVDSMPQAYAAHRGGGFPPPPVPPAPCDGDSCQGPLAPEPPLGSAASATFTGPGNQGQRAKKKQAKKKQKKQGKRKAAKRCVKAKGKKAAKCKQKKKRAAKGKGRAGR